MRLAICVECRGLGIVTEAGGIVTDLSGKPIAYQASDFSQQKGLLATNGKLHEDVLKKLSQ